jgi:hypothetical protein
MTGEDAIRFISEIHPYLMLKRSQAQLILEYKELTMSLSLKDPIHRQWTQEAKETALKMKERMHSLNAKGPNAHFAGGQWWTPMSSSGKCTVFKEKWLPQGMIVDGEYYPLQTLEPDTKGRGGSYWQTPKAMMVEEDYLPYLARMQRSNDPKTNTKIRPSSLAVQVKTPEFWPTPAASESGRTLEQFEENKTRGTKLGGMGLSIAVQMWPTPTAKDELGRAYQISSEKIYLTLEGAAQSGMAFLGNIGMEQDFKESAVANNMSVNALIGKPQIWPTPRAMDYKDCGPVGSKSQVYRMERKYLDATVKTAEIKGQLNPTWVEYYLMGFPLLWSKAHANILKIMKK